MPEITTIVCGNCGSGTLVTVKIPPEEMPAPPGALLGVADFPDKAVGGSETICQNCGRTVMVAYDYGKVDLGLVRDEDLERGDDFEVFG